MVRQVLLFGAMLWALPAMAHAKSVSGTMEVSLVVEPSCNVSATPLSFAGRAGEAMDAASDIRVACNGDTPVAVRLDAGLNAEGAGRRLTGPGGLVRYALYSDPARSLLWGAGEPLSGIASAAPLMLAAYGRIDAGTTIGTSGSFTDTITVTVDF